MHGKAADDSVGVPSFECMQIESLTASPGRRDGFPDQPATRPLRLAATRSGSAESADTGKSKFKSNGKTAAARAVSTQGQRTKLNRLSRRLGSLVPLVGNGPYAIAAWHDG